MTSSVASVSGHANLRGADFYTTAPRLTPDGTNGGDPVGAENLVRDGFDLIWRQAFLQEQMTNIEEDIAKIEQNANLSDTEKMFSMQMAMNTWSAVTNLRTNMLKSVSDSLKTIVRNVA